MPQQSGLGTNTAPPPSCTSQLRWGRGAKNRNVALDPGPSPGASPGARWLPRHGWPWGVTLRADPERPGPALLHHGTMVL